MKNFVLVLVLVFALTSLTGCGKKKKDELADLNGVATDNVVSVTDTSMQEPGDNAIPVVVDNAAAVVSEDRTDTASAMENTSKASPKLIQQALKNAGFYNGKVDGAIGPKTKKAIEAFQTHNGLKAYGKVGAKTWKALSSYLNKNAEVANPSADSQAIGQ